jgi:hypothetical protein
VSSLRHVAQEYFRVNEDSLVLGALHKVVLLQATDAFGVEGEYLFMLEQP